MAGKRKKAGGLPHLPGRPDPTKVQWQPTWQPNTGGGKKNPPGGGKKPGKGQGGQKPGKGQGGGKRNKTSLYERATNDVNVAYQPQLDAIQMSQLQAQQQYADDAERVRNIYGSLLGQLQPLNGQYDQAAQGISSDLSNQIGGLAGLLGSNVAGVPSSEIAAGTNAVGAQGTGTLESLATDRARNLDYNTSAQRQGGIEQMTTSRNYLQDLQDMMDQFSQRGLDITAQMPSLIQSRIGELQDQRWQKRMAKKEFNLRKKATMSELKGNKALSKYTGASIKGALNQGGGGGGGGGKPYQPSGGGGGGGGGGGTRNPAGSGNPVVAVNHIVSGATPWRSITPGDMQAIRNSWNDARVMVPVREEYMRLFPNKPFTVSGPEDIVAKLKEISQAHAGLAADPNGPGNPGR